MPAEISTKIPVSRKRQVVTVHKRVVRDPRFDTLSGEYNPGLFKRTYGFLDDLKIEEMETLKRDIRREKDPEMKEKLQRGLQLMQQRQLAEKNKERRQAIKRDFRKQQEERVRQGKRAAFLKKCISHVPASCFEF